MDPKEVGTAAGTILALDDASIAKHDGKIYNLSGPRDETGKDIVGMKYWSMYSILLI